MIELQRLSEDETAYQIAQAFWELNEDGSFKNKVIDIALRFNLEQGSVLPLARRGATALNVTVRCLGCNIARPISSRHELLESNRRKGQYAFMKWECKACQNQRHQEDAKKIVQIVVETDCLDAALSDIPTATKHAFTRTPSMRLEHLRVEDILYLVTLMRHAATEDLSVVSPVCEFSTPLTPTPERDEQLLMHLYEQNLIAIEPSNQRVNWTSNHIEGFNPRRVSWVLPWTRSWRPLELMTELEDLLASDHWSDEWRAQCRPIHRIVAIDECKQYYAAAMRDFGFEPDIGEKTSAVLSCALNNFTISQVFNFISQAASDAAVSCLSAKLTKANAARAVPNALQREIERADVEQRRVEPFSRHRDGPESTLSHVLFVKALRLPAGGLMQPIQSQY